MSWQTEAPRPPLPTTAPNTPNFGNIETFVKALTQPTEAVYGRIAEDASLTNAKPYRWIFGFALIAAIILEVARIAWIGNEILSVWYTALPRVVMAPILTVLGIAVGVWCRQWIASRLGGVGSYETLLYVYTAQTAPLLVLDAVVKVIPAITVLSVPLALYALYLTALGVKVVHQLSWVKAFIAATVISIIGIAILYLLNWQLYGLF